MEYLQQHELYLSGDIPIDDLKSFAVKAFGNQNVSLRSHLTNMEQLAIYNIERFSEEGNEFRQVQNALLAEYVQLINMANINRYDFELKARESEWQLQFKDIEEKYLSWLGTSGQILEKGREDWKDNSVKLTDA
jgi:hypothetical protein